MKRRESIEKKKYIVLLSTFTYICEADFRDKKWFVTRFLRLQTCKSFVKECLESCLRSFFTTKNYWASLVVKKYRKSICVNFYFKFFIAVIKLFKYFFYYFLNKYHWSLIFIESSKNPWFMTVTLSLSWHQQ